MNITIHRGTHQIGGVATELRTASTRILIDMGDELGMDSDFIPKALIIPGVTDNSEKFDAIFITHYHGDHIGQLINARADIPIYIGDLSKELLLATLRESKRELRKRIENANTFRQGEAVVIGDITVTPYSIDHSACDSYMFLIEADGKRTLHTGDFRLHGFRGKAVPKILDAFIGKVNALIIEGTTLSRKDNRTLSERDLQSKLKDYMEKYKYVFVLCASTNLERICAMAKAVPRGRYFVCDEYQSILLDLIQKHYGKHSSLYYNIKKTTYGENILAKLSDKGFLMVVRDNSVFRRIIKKFDSRESIILYSMWDGYRTKTGSTIPSFLELTNHWESLHTSGHATQEDICMVIEKTNPDIIIPIHTEKPETLQALCPQKKIVLSADGKEVRV